MRPAPRRNVFRSLLARRLAVVLLGAGLAAAWAATLEAAPETTADAGWTRTRAAVDAAVEEKLREAGVAGAPAADDAEFLRRVTLDLTGTIPTADEARAFLESKDPAKRALKIEALLGSPAYAEFWSHWWYRTLTGMTPNAGKREGEQARLLRGPADEAFQAWLARQFQENAPYDRFATALITATGRTNENGATGWFARWDGKPNDLAGAVAKTFLGVKIQCAQCHDHMYEPTWKQKDFQGMASFFVLSAPRPVPEYQQAYREVEKLREQRMKEMGEEGEAAPDKNGNGKPDKKALLDGELRKDPALRDALRNRFVMDIVDAEPGSLARGLGRVPKDKLPEGLQERTELASVTPKAWMGPTLPDLPGLTRREMLARWVTSPDNPYFARALVNRYWGHLFGRGLVDPVDDFTSMNPPSHPALLDLLAADFRANGHDVKRLLRILVSTAAYQRTSVGTAPDEPDPALFAKAAVKSLSNEQLFHALVTATGTQGLIERGGRRDALGTGYGRGRDAAFTAFTFLFEDDEGAEADDFAGSIPQGLFLMNGRMIQGALSGLPGATVSRALADEPTDAARVERLYLSAYGRTPDADERRAALAYVKQGADERAGWQDLFWVLLNSAEFMSNH
jgi:hypothetical protein